MRKIIPFNNDWKFSKQPDTAWEAITLPHTWNALDGQDGGDDYYRGSCYYKKTFNCPKLETGKQVYLECAGVSNSAVVMLNGVEVGRHDGGFSTFRVNLTKNLQDENTLVIVADNSENDRVYPQKADFTFYGGIYRDVKLVVVPETHFQLDYYGGNGVKVTPVMMDGQAEVTVEAWITDEEQKACADITEQGNMAVRISITGENAPESIMTPLEDASKYVSTKLVIPNPHLWNGRKDPYLYRAQIELLADGHVVDKVM